MSDPQTNELAAELAELDQLIGQQQHIEQNARYIRVRLQAMRNRLEQGSDPELAEIDRLAAKGQEIYESLPPSNEPNEFIEMAERGELPYIVPATLTREQALANLKRSDQEKAARRQSFRDAPVEPMDLDRLNNLPHVMPEMHKGWTGDIPTGESGSMTVEPSEKEFSWKMTPEPTVADHIDAELKRPRNRKSPWWKRG